ncbi:MAG: TIGR02757 family protein [Verrucomicrobia bacterium]|nr:TIGR02757 family protein [Verrucomicrobiota bacterium]
MGSGGVFAPSVQSEMLEELYELYNRRRFVHPDPLELLYEYNDGRDREIVALVASSLAYGRVAQILRSVRAVLDRIGSPAACVHEGTPAEIRAALHGLRHRWTTGRDVAALLVGVKRVVEEHGSLEACFVAGLHEDDETTVPALTGFVAALRGRSGAAGARLLPDPARGSACKRLHLFLRWMVRRDEVDPGGWDRVPRSKLVVPLDTHMHAIARGLGLTARRQADGGAALEVTAAFRRLNPRDPVKYDFALTRVGIRTEMEAAGFLKSRAA